MFEILILIIFAMYCFSQNQGYNKYQKVKQENLDHKTWHKSEWLRTGWTGKERGCPPPPCSQCITDVLYYG